MGSESRDGVIPGMNKTTIRWRRRLCYGSTEKGALVNEMVRIGLMNRLRI
jgi:hypothetical protein